MRAGVLVACLACACSASDRTSPSLDGGSRADARPASDAGPEEGCGELESCFTVYVNTDRELYLVDLTTKELVDVGPFLAPYDDALGGEDVITDIAVSPEGELFGISAAAFYTIDHTNGKATQVGPLDACGAFGVALSFAPDGNLYSGDYNGEFCRIDPSVSPPTVTPIGNLGGTYALSGDLVAVSDGTLFGTAYDTADFGTQDDNFLVKIDPETGHATRLAGSIGHGRLFGVAYDVGLLFAFSHDGTGQAVTVDPTTGVGTPYATFTAPGTGTPLVFAGAGVNANVPPDVD